MRASFIDGLILNSLQSVGRALQNLTALWLLLPSSFRRPVWVQHRARGDPRSTHRLQPQRKGMRRTAERTFRTRGW